MTILVTGARGSIGRTVVAQLHAAGHPVRAASADPSGATVPSGVELAALRLDAAVETFTAALRDVRQVFLYAEPAGIGAFVAAAREAGVEHVVLMSSSAVLSPSPNPLADHHLAVEKALTATDLAVTALRPGAFASNSLAWSHAFESGTPIEQAYPDAAVAVIHPADIADIAVAALTGTLARGAYRLSGPESLTFRRQLDIIAEVTGAKADLVEIEPAMARAQLTQHMPPGYADSLLDFWADATATPEAVADTTESLLGTPARDFTRWVTENAAAFTRP